MFHDCVALACRGVARMQWYSMAPAYSIFINYNGQFQLRYKAVMNSCQFLSTANGFLDKFIQKNEI